MTKLDAKNMPAKELCARIRESTDTALAVEHVNGQRYIAAGLGKKELTLTGTPGNALGAYLNGTRITVLGNAQDATGDTMNDGAIFVHGSSGDATGYAMRGGELIVRDGCGWRGGINMKQYGGFIPGIRAGSATSRYLSYVMNRLNTVGAVYLLFVALIPTVLIMALDLNTKLPFGGTTILIIAGVGLDTLRQAKAQTEQFQYAGFLFEGTDHKEGK